MEKIIKLVLAILLFGCLLKLPYGYYQLVRFVAVMGFAILSYHSKKQGEETQMIVYGAVALIFQPFFKIALGRELWNIVDLIVGVGLLVSLFKNRKNE